MILNNGYKGPRFVELVEATIAGGGPCPRLCTDEDLLAASEQPEGLYLAGGYWRARLVYEGGKLTGLELINPDRTWAECRDAEKGIAVLRHLEYR